MYRFTILGLAAIPALVGATITTTTTTLAACTADNCLRGGQRLCSCIHIVTRELT
jgi:hypothetical protein